MAYDVIVHEINPQNYIVMEPYDFELFVSNHKLAVFDDEGEVFTYYNGIQVVKMYRATKNE